MMTDVKSGMSVESPTICLVCNRTLDKCACFMSKKPSSLPAPMGSDASKREVYEYHAGDCTIYRSVANGRPADGICTCGYGWTLVRQGDWSEMYSAERQNDAK